MRTSRFFVAFSLFMALSSGIGCSGSPTGSSEVNCASCPNQNGQIGPSNRPQSPPGGIPASLAHITYGLYKGDCAADLNSCTDEVSSSSDVPNVSGIDNGGYWLATHKQMYTLKACITHIGWAGRTVFLQVSARTSGASITFDEGDKTKPSTYCLGTAFNLMITDVLFTNNAIGKVNYQESGYDLFDYEPVNTARLNLGFQVVGTK